MSAVRKILVCGGRTYVNIRRVYSVLGAFKPDEIVEGGADGADKFARSWAARSQVICHTYPARWRAEGRAAGPIRNGRMIAEKPGLVIAFPGGDGTADMVRQARQKKVPVLEVPDVGRVHLLSCGIVRYWDDTWPRCTCDGLWPE